MNKYTTPYSSREIYKNGKPFITINPAKDAETEANKTTTLWVEVDDEAKNILRLLNFHAEI